MTMASSRRSLPGWAALAVVLAAPATALAQPCVTVSSPAVLSVTGYNPFESAVQASNPLSLTLTRNTAAPDWNNGAFNVRLQILDADTLSGTPRIGTSPLSGLSVTHTTAGSGSILRAGPSNFAPGNPFALGEFVGNTQTLALTNFRLNVPGSIDVASGTYSESFDVALQCSRGSNVQTYLLPGAISAQVAVQARVRAVAVGNVTVGSILVNPASGIGQSALNVQSSGPFTVSVESLNAFALRPGGSVGTLPPDQIMPYALGFAGTSVGSSSTLAQRTRTCARTGTAGDSLPFQATLAGSAATLRRGQYGDTLTVTVTPALSGPSSGCTS